jgi:hypothetical protein
MEKQTNSLTKERNPITQQAHRRETFWQITLPFLVGVLIILALAVAASWGAMGKVSTWANIGASWLILLTFLPGLIVFVLLIALVYGVTWLFVRLPGYAKQMHDIFLMIVYQVKTYSDKTVEPVLRIESARASLKSILHK